MKRKGTPKSGMGHIRGVSIRALLSTNPIIAACSYEALPEAVESSAPLVLLMGVGITQLVRPDFQSYSEAKPILIHADLLRGLSGDRETIVFLREFIRPAGIVSTKGAIVRAARKEGLTAIQRLFLIDTKSLRASVDSIRENEPDAVEIMPGIAIDVIPEILESVDVPIIMAGLVRRREQVFAALRAGADGVSMSERSLWNEVYLIPERKNESTN